MTQLAINTIRTLSIDAVSASEVGHPGTPMALAPLVYTLLESRNALRSPGSIWPNRDRFVLSNAMPRCFSGPYFISPESKL